VAYYKTQEVPGLEVGVDYSPNNGKVNFVQVRNYTAAPVWVQIILTSGQAVEQTFAPAPAGSPPVNIDVRGSGVTLTFDAADEPTWGGILSISTR
jgi:hypothetical protein